MKSAIFGLKFTISVMLAAVPAAVALQACSGAKSSYIKIKGSETVLPIALELAERFSNDPNLPDVSVTAGGSGVGIAALLQGNTHIAMASRSIKFSERMAMHDRGLAYEELLAAYDALALITHKDNPVDSLTLEQLKKIYKGEFTNWNQVGGANRRIVAFNRESSSGTYEFFKQAVLKGDVFANLQTVGANGELVEKVMESESTIGYVGISFVDTRRVKQLMIYNPELKRSITPGIESAMDGSYPLNRPLYFYYLQRDTGLLAPIVNFIQSREGQDMVRSVGYPPNPAFLRD